MFRRKTKQTQHPLSQDIPLELLIKAMLIRVEGERALTGLEESEDLFTESNREAQYTAIRNAMLQYGEFVDAIYKKGFEDLKVEPQYEIKWALK